MDRSDAVAHNNIDTVPSHASRNQLTRPSVNDAIEQPLLVVYEGNMDTSRVETMAGFDSQDTSAQHHGMFRGLNVFHNAPSIIQRSHDVNASQIGSDNTSFRIDCASL